MKIRTQLILGAALFGLVLVVLAASMITTTAELGRLDRQVAVADRIGIAASDLNYLSNEYLLYGEPQQLERWEARYASLGDDLANLSAGTPGQQALVTAITEDRQQLRGVFDGIAAARSGGPPDPADPAALQVSWSRIGIQTQGLAYDALRLSNLLRDEADGVRTVNSLLAAALLGAFAVVLLTNYFVVGRRTVRSITTILAGAKVIGTGDLDHAIAVTGDDEVSELSTAFNRMTADLRTVTASRAELEREVTSRKIAEQVVRERERTLQSIFQAAPVGIGISSHRVIRSANDYFRPMTGYAPDELIGQGTRMLYPGDEAYDAVGKEKYAQIIENGVGAVETQWRRKDGTVIDIQLSASPMDRSAPYENVVTIALDVTALHEKEAALRESEAKYRNLVELSPDAILIHQDGTIVFANPAAAALVGAARPEDLLGRPVLEIVHPGTREHAEVNIEKDLRGEESPVTIIDLLRNDGTTVPVQGRGAMIPFSGRPAVQVVLRDVTEEKRAEAALEAERGRLQAVLAGMTDAYYVYDREWRFAEINQRAAEYFGRAREELLGRNVWELYPETVGDQTWTEYHRAMAEGVPVHFETQFGVDPRFFEVHAYPQPDGLVVYMRDITERKRAEEALRTYAEDLKRSNEDLERYAYVSSHDLQEPLRSIVSFSQLLERRYRGRLGTDADEYIEFIVEGGNRMQALIQDLLTYSRVNTTKQELTPTDTAAVLASVERSLTVPLCGAGGVITHDPMPVVLADPIQLEQVLANLVSNALKFRRPDEPLRIHVGARKTDGFWEFSVRDNGIGIEAEYFDRIFVIFQRLHTKDVYPGTGIGLAIVKRIIDRHGGRVWVESTPGEGTTFFFTLPAA